MQHIQSIWQRSAVGQLTEVEFAEWTYRRRVAHSVTVTYRLLCMFLWIFRCATIVEKVTTITCNTFNRYGSVAPWVS